MFGKEGLEAPGRPPQSIGHGGKGLDLAGIEEPLAEEPSMGVQDTFPNVSIDVTAGTSQDADGILNRADRAKLSLLFSVRSSEKELPRSFPGDRPLVFHVL